MMEDAVLLLLMLFVLVMASFMLDKYSCMLVSQSGFALVFGLLVGLLVVASGRKETLNHHLNLSNNLFFDILLPPIIYEGGFSIKRQAFFRNFPAIMSTAVFGTVIATCVTGGALYLGGVYRIVPALSWVEAFLFGSLISAVDPVATLACFNKLHAPPLLFNLVFGESVMNDAVAIALYQTLAKWEPDIDLSAKELLLVAANTGGMFVCSLLVSMAITLLGAFLLKRKVFATLRHYPAYEISLCLIFSLLTYFIADSLHLSGIVALFFSGTMTAHYHFHTISKSAQHSFTHLLHTLAFISENFVYLFMGTSVVMLFAGPVEKSAGAALRVDDIDWTFIGLTLLACVAARFCNIFPLLGLSNCTRPPADRIPVKYMSVIWFAGLRGSIAFALAKSWQYKGLHNHSHKKLIESTTLMIVIFTTLVIGGLTGPLLTCLNLADSSKRSVLMTDTESSANESPDVTCPRSRSESTAHARRKQPGSAHYVMSRGSIHHPRDSMSDAASVISDGLDLDNPDTVLTPRPQFQDTSDDDDDQWDASLHPRPPTIHRQASLSRRESYTGAFFRTWNFFDASYMQPIFGGELAQADAAARRPSSAMNHETLAMYKKENVLCTVWCYPLKIDEFPIIAWSNLTGKLELHPPHWNNLPSSSFGGALRIAARHYAVHRRRMAPPTYYHGSTDPLEALGDDMSGVGLGYGGASHDNNAGHDGGDSEEATDAAAPLPSVETMEDLIIEAYNNMQSDGEHIFLPTDVASKLQFIAEMVKGAGYTSDDLVSNSSESNQEEGARALLPSGQHDTAPRSEASSAPSSPPIDHLSFTDTALSQHISHLQLDGNHAPSPVLDEHRKPIEPLQLDSNNFEDVETTLSAAAIASNAEFAPALSPVQEIAEDLLSISDFGSIRERPQETLTPPRLSTSPSRERAFQGDAKPKSKLRKPEVHRKTAVPARPLSNKSLERNNPPSSATRSHLPRARTESQTPPTSRERSTSSSYEQRREAAQKLKDEKAQRELQARDAARKQREEARLKLEEAQQKESAAKRERATRMRMQKDSQRKGPPKSGPKTR